jgi:hypothetical protein
MIAMDWRRSGSPLSCRSQKPGPFLHHNQRYIEITHGPFFLVLSKGYFDCPQRDSHAVHYI